jgi:hypothetical protein
MPNNPLSEYFRQPAIFVRLPSQGKFYPPGSLVETANAEYPVLPMTTMDEITYRTPDALFNGSATVAVIQSCVPNIRDAWHMPGIDLDTVLTAIRIASYGHTMDISVRCPNCGTEADYAVDLRRAMEQIQADNYAAPLEMGNLRIYFKPMTYQQMNANNMQQFEDQKNLQNLQNLEEGASDQQLENLGSMLRKITSFTTRALSQNIGMIKTPDAEVTNADHIAEWLTNCDVKDFRTVRDAILERKRSSEIKPIKITCGNCSHQYEQNYTLDLSNFFAAAS